MRYLATIIAIFIFATPAIGQGLDWRFYHRDTQHTGRTTIYGPDTGRLYWSFQGGERFNCAPVIDRIGQIYVGNNDNFFYSISRDGSLKWSYQTGHDIANTACIDSYGSIYFASKDRNMYCLNSDGTLRWSFATMHDECSSPVTLSDGRLVFGGDQALYCLSSHGDDLWKFKTGALVTSSPAVDYRDNIVFSNFEGTLYALNSDGSLRWSYGLVRPHTASPVLDETVIYIGSGDNRLYSMNERGMVLWSFGAKGSIFTTAALNAQGQIFFGSDDRYLYALNSDGRLAWKYRTGDQIKSDPVVGGGGTVYLGSNDRKIYSVDSTGQTRWSYLTEGRVWGSAAISPTGSLVVGSWDSGLYVFRNATPAPDRSPPYFTQPTPQPNERSVPRDTAIRFHLRDDLLGVDETSVKLYVEDEEQNYSFNLVNDHLDIEILYQPDTVFSAGEVVTVAVEACDRAPNPNCMVPVAYSFTISPETAKVIMAGYLDSGLYAGKPGELKIAAICNDRTEAVAIYMNGQLSGAFLEPVNSDWYSIRIPFDITYTPGRYVLELTPYDADVYPGPMWPYLQVE